MRPSKKIISIEELLVHVERLRSEGKKIVYTSGTFDMIHEGHLEYLYCGKDFGDSLIVGVDTDRRTKIEKGPDRPKIGQDARSFLIAGFECVDYVVLSDMESKEDDRNALTKLIRPDVLLISKDTKKREQRDNFEGNMQRILGEYVGRVECLPPQASTSTSNLIRTLTMSGKLDFLAELGEFMAKHGYELKEKPVK